MANPLSSTEQIREEFLATGDAGRLIQTRSQMVDDIVKEAWQQWLQPVFPKGMTLLAVGGYGRQELFPFSDVDLLILVEKAIDGDAQREALGGFLRTLWDTGLRLSQSVRTIPECCELDSRNVELSISLLDERLLVGDPVPRDALNERLPKFFQRKRQELVGHLSEMTRARHAKYHNTIYHLEPNIKETPGGMRDLHVIHWLSKLKGSVDEPAPALEAARDFLSALRCRLHYQAGRDSNVLSFTIQEEIESNPEQWMREYYRHARSINRAALRHLEIAETSNEGGLLRQFQDWRSRLSNPEFSVNRERVFFKSPQQLQSDPELVLRLFQFVARHGIRPALEAERRISDNIRMFADHFSMPRRLWPAIQEIFAQPHAELAARSMHDTGLLMALFPEFCGIECLVIRDFYHRYTVDEHTIVTLEAIGDLRTTKDNNRKRFADLLAEIDQPATMLMALLFHDVGKGSDAPSHSEQSVVLAKQAFDRIQMPAGQQKAALFLIEQHLSLSAVMNARDLNDPETGRDLAHRIGTIENLKQLTLVTYADISAVNPDAMTPWRMEQLWRVYLLAHHEFTRELDAERIEAAPSAQSADFLEGFPTRYLRTHSPDEIKWHSELHRLSKVAGVAVDLKRQESVYSAIIVTADRPSLFASLAGILSGFGMNIVKAEAFANRRGTVLDTFLFEDPMRTLELNPMEIERLKLMLQRAALGKEDVQRLLKGRARPAVTKGLRISPTVAIDSEASATATLVEITAEDRPGLLYDIAEKFSSAGCSIEVVLIDTEAHKALDVFYVTANGAKLSEELQAKLKEELLAVCRA